MPRRTEKWADRVKSSAENRAPYGLPRDGLVTALLRLTAPFSTYAGHLWSRLSARLLRASHRHPYVFSVASASVALGFAVILNSATGIDRPSRIFILAILVAAIANGLWPALFASLICALLYDFFFLPPLFSFGIDTVEGAVDLIMFVCTAAIVTALASGVRRHSIQAERRALTAEKLAAVGRDLAVSVTEQQIAETAVQKTALLTGRAAVAILPGDDGLTVRARAPGSDEPSADEVSAAAAWWALGAADVDHATGDFGEWHFVSLHDSAESRGMLAVRATAEDTSDTPAEAWAPLPSLDPLLDALARTTALALQRCAMSERLETARLRAETDRLRGAVFGSVSHDLRAPLTSVVGALSSLDYRWATLPDETRRSLVRRARDEVMRLDAYVEKLLTISRIEAHAVRAMHDTVSLRDVAEVAVEAVGRALAGHPVSIAIPDSMPPVLADPLLLRQVLSNLLENAAKYSPAGSEIEVDASEEGAFATLRVLDHGNGIAEGDHERIFEKFYRSPMTQGNAPGNGVGLAIAKGFVEAMGGTIAAANRGDGVGALFAVRLPIGFPSPAEEQSVPNEVAR